MADILINDLTSGKGLKLVHNKICELYTKINQISLLYNDVDILNFSETWLHNLCTDDMIKLRGKTCFRIDHIRSYKMVGIRREVVGWYVIYVMVIMYLITYDLLNLPLHCDYCF